MNLFDAMMTYGDRMFPEEAPGLMQRAAYWKNNYNSNHPDAAGTSYKFYRSQVAPHQAPKHIQEALRLSELVQDSDGLMDQTLRHETHYGEYEPYASGDHRGGVAQVTQGTFDALNKKRTRTMNQYRQNVQDRLGIDLDSVEYEDLAYNPLLSTLYGRMKYLSNPDPIPPMTTWDQLQWKDLPSFF